MAIGHHKMEYEVLEGWEQLPEGWSFVEVAGVVVDSQDRVYVFNRGEHPVIVFDKEGKFLNAWGEDIFTNAHGIYIDENDHLFCTDHFDHTVRKLTTDGELLMTLGDIRESRRHRLQDQSQPGLPFRWSLQYGDQRGGRSRWRSLRFRRLRQRACPPVQRRRRAEGVLG